MQNDGVKTGKNREFRRLFSGGLDAHSYRSRGGVLCENEPNSPVSPPNNRHHKKATFGKKRCIYDFAYTFPAKTDCLHLPYWSGFNNRFCIYLYFDNLLVQPVPVYQKQIKHAFSCLESKRGAYRDQIRVQNNMRTLLCETE